MSKKKKQTTAMDELALRTAKMQKRLMIRKNIPLYIMLVIPIAYFAVFCYGPMGGLVMAFENYKLAGELMEKLKTVCGERNILVEHLEYSNGRYTDPADPVIEMLLDTCHEFLGEDYKAYTMGGGTHARKFPNALSYGPGGVKLEKPNPYGSAHGIDEAVSIEGLLKSMSVYAAAILRLDAVL